MNLNFNTGRTLGVNQVFVFRDGVFLTGADYGQHPVTVEMAERCAAVSGGKSGPMTSLQEATVD